MAQSLPPSIGIIGAGPAGLTAAYLLSKAELKLVVFEVEPYCVGGISRTIIYKGYRFDIGGHRFFSKSQEVEDFWTEILPDDFLVRERISRIYYKGKFYSYPLDAAEVIDNIGKRQAALTLASYLKAKLFQISSPGNLEDWVIQKFGGRLYQMFFKSYTEKVWGMPCKEISVDWAAQRIKGLSLSKAVRNALFPANLMDLGKGKNRSKVIKTLITSFRYPRLGPGMLWEAAADKIQDGGGTIQMGTRVIGIERKESGMWQVESECNGVINKVEVDHLISSAPLGWLIQTIQPSLPTEALEAAASLSYRDFLTVALIVRPSVSFPDNWLYIHDPELKVGRIQNFANWSPEMVPDPAMACYGMEYFTSTDEPFWKQTDAELISLATRELEILRLVQPGDVVDGAVVRQPKAYPVYDDYYSACRNILQETIRKHCPNLHVVGRNGMHQYNNQDHSMMTAMLTVKNILADEQKYDVWKVNQDAEYLESDSKNAS